MVDLGWPIVTTIIIVMHPSVQTAVTAKTTEINVEKTYRDLSSCSE